jgi:hypothetical protein
MRRICVYIFSILALIISSSPEAKSQDTLFIPMKINAGIEVIGPVNYFINNSKLSAEGYVSVDLNQKWAAALNAGYLDYQYSQYNYSYLSKGFFIRAGGDFNMLKPKKSLGIYWGGLSLRYGLSRFEWEVPELSQTNYWGESASSIPANTKWGHFIEASPGMRAQIFRNFSMGWSINLRMLLYTGNYNGIKPIYFPGFGNAEKRISTGFSYFLVWHIPYKKTRVIIPKEEPQEEEDTEENPDQNRSQDSGTTGGFRQQQPGSNLR